MKCTIVLVLNITLLLMLGCSEDSIDSIESKNTKHKYVEHFEGFPIVDNGSWVRDIAVYDGPYSESGEFYQKTGTSIPDAYRNSISLGETGWLNVEIYTRTKEPIILDYIDTIQDPLNPANQVIKISTPAHTDGVIIRSKNPLPKYYKISLKIGFASYGNESPLNGYDSGDEMATPWRELSSVGHNGFYWLAIFDKKPIPHNNIWSHHHRKFVIDSWNREGANNSINVIALDGVSETSELFGKKFISYVEQRRWDKQQNVPLDYYLSNQWYEVTFTRTDSFYEFSIKGQFKNGGYTTYQGRIDYKKECVFHYNQSIEEQNTACVDHRTKKYLGKKFTSWPMNSFYPDYFMLGEPHINYYEGSVLVDDMILEVL
ncbi:MAG: hypothetical protein MJK12_11960 [Colwellia sp.]|nr:hypothetical protein [Colwellia sp.]